MWMRHWDFSMDKKLELDLWVLSTVAMLYLWKRLSRGERYRSRDAEKAKGTNIPKEGDEDTHPKMH